MNLKIIHFITHYNNTNTSIIIVIYKYEWIVTVGEILENGGDHIKSTWPLWAGPHTCYNGNDNDNGRQDYKA
jgi:hypothetical protein